MAKPTKKALIMRAEVAQTEIGKAFTQAFEVRFSSNLQADVILPGPPISWALLFLDELATSRLLSAVSRLDRMVAMFEHAIVVLIRPSSESLFRLQQHLNDSGAKHLGTKLLFFPDTPSATSSILHMCPMLTDVSRRRGQLEVISQLRDEQYLGVPAIMPVLKRLISGGNFLGHSNCGDVLEKDANLLLDRFSSLSAVIAYGNSSSFRDLSAQCPLEESTVHQLDMFFAAHQLDQSDFVDLHGATRPTSLFENTFPPGRSDHAATDLAADETSRSSRNDDAGPYSRFGPGDPLHASTDFDRYEMQCEEPRGNYMNSPSHNYSKYLPDEGYMDNLVLAPASHCNHNNGNFVGGADSGTAGCVDQRFGRRYFEPGESLHFQTTNYVHGDYDSGVQYAETSSSNDFRSEFCQGASLRNRPELPIDVDLLSNGKSYDQHFEHHPHQALSPEIHRGDSHSSASIFSRTTQRY